MYGTDKHGVTRRHFLRDMGCAAAGGAVGSALWGSGLLAGAPPPPSEPEARFYERLEGGRVRCGLCPRRCVVPDGGRGYCRVRANRGGRYVTLVYGRPCAANLDPIEKKPFFHVYPGSQAYSIATVGCNMHCRFCQNWDIAQASPEDAPVPYRGPEDVAAEAARLKARTIAYTYSEPTIFYEYLADCARAGRERGIESVMVSNGFIADAPQRALFPLMKAIKIDLKAFTQSFYGEICDGVLEPVLETLKRLAGSGVWYEIVVLVIPTLNDGADEIARMSAWIVKALGPEVPVHFSRYHPMYRLRNLPPTPEATLLKARETARKEGCRFVYIGNVPGTEGQDTVCPGCGKTIIRRYGYRIEANHIRDGKCTFCGRAIPGVWG